MPAATWKDHLAGRMPSQMADEIDAFEAQMLLRKQGKLDEKVFAETRLRRGIYGQRYDSGHRHDGKAAQQLAFPSADLTKGPDTLWDAPGMMRIKIPFGGMNPPQMIALAELAEEYSDGICHITTRQDVQLHYVHIEDTPALMRRLAAVGITTREACGNSVRNVTGCPLAGVCRTESFDVTPYAKAMAYFLLGHPDTQDFGRKFKIAFSGCRDEACALVAMHDFGCIAVQRDGRRGFEVYVGGGLGSVPYQAKLLEPFVAEEQIMPLAQAVARVYARLGEKKNRNKARIKFLVAKLGIDEFRRLVQEEQRTMPQDGGWRKYFDEIPQWSETPGTSSAVSPRGAAEPSSAFESWRATNVYAQRQSAYAVATITLPLGDASSNQMRALARLAERFAGGNARTTVEQNIVFRWVRETDLPALYAQLQAIALAEAGAGTIVDVVACPGTDTCKLGIASSRGLAGELRTRLAARSASMDNAIRSLRIKISGCFNSCGQHHVADMGFYGNSRNVGNFTVPHFQVVLGGQWHANAGAYGMTIGAIPSKAIPQVVDRITGRFVQERQGAETFQDFCKRIGKKALREMIDDLSTVPPHQQDASYYSDWGDPREFTISDLGVGECAGEVVSAVQFGFRDAESAAFEAQLLHEAGQYQQADEKAYQAMLLAARTLVRIEFPDVPADAPTVIDEFRRRFVDTKLFWDKYAQGKFAQYLFSRHESPDTRYTRDSAHRTAEEAALFIDAAHACHARILAAGPPGGPPGAPMVQLKL